MPQVCRPFETPVHNNAESVSLLVLVVSLHMALLWRDPLFAAGSAPDAALTVGFLSLQALLGCAFVAVQAKFVKSSVAACLKSRPRLLSRRGLQAMRQGSLAGRGPPPSRHSVDTYACSPAPLSLYTTGAASQTGTSNPPPLRPPRTALVWFALQEQQGQTVMSAGQLIGDELSKSGVRSGSLWTP